MNIIPETCWDWPNSYLPDEGQWPDIDDNEKEVCSRCLQRFGTQNRLDEWETEEDRIKPTDNLSIKSLTIIGDNGLKRFEEFIQYRDGWDFGIGETLSSQSIALLDTFINIYFDCFKTEPSLFLTRAGNLQLGWEDKHEKAIELEFFPNKIEYYIESKEEEGEVNIRLDKYLQDFLKVIDKLGCE